MDAVVEGVEVVGWVTAAVKHLVEENSGWSWN